MRSAKVFWDLPCNLRKCCRRKAGTGSQVYTAILGKHKSWMKMIIKVARTQLLSTRATLICEHSQYPIFHYTANLLFRESPVPYIPPAFGCCRHC